MKDTTWKAVLWFALGWFLCTLYGAGNANAGELVKVDGGLIVIHGTLTDEQREAEARRRNEAGAVVAQAFREEIERKHEKEVEIQKFANALMLEYAKAPKTYVSVGQSVQVKQQIKQRIDQSA